MEYFIILILAIAILYLYRTNIKLTKESEKLKEILEVKDSTISNYEASRVAVKDVIENISSHQEVMKLVEAGESRESISEQLDIPVSKIELIVKFDKIKKEQPSAS